jgi:hypothetical protein
MLSPHLRSLILFSFGMPHVTLQISSSIPATNANPSVGPGGMAPPHTPLSFGGGHIPQMNPTIGGQPPFPPRSNPSLNAPGWSAQPGGQATSYIPSFPPSSSMSILTNTFFMTNHLYPPEFHPEGVSITLSETPSLELL